MSVILRRVSAEESCPKPLSSLNLPIRLDPSRSLSWAWRRTQDDIFGVFQHAVRLSMLGSIEMGEGHNE